MRNSDVVVSALGMKGKGAGAICTHGTRAILNAMTAEGVDRLIVLSAYGAGDSRGRSLTDLLVRSVIGAKMRDKDAMEALVRASSVAWTIVRPPALTNGKRTGSYRKGAHLKLGLASHISRADVADFIVREISAPEHLVQAVALSL